MFDTKTVTIVYKSGVKVHLRCKSFTVTRYASGNRGFDWDGMVGVKPLLLGADDIAAVFEGKV